MTITSIRPYTGHLNTLCLLVLVSLYSLFTISMPRRSDEAPLIHRASSTRFEAAERMEGSRKKRVLVVGAGAAGMFCVAR